ncbi:gamma-aminobutyric acid type B receptor subunit 1 isoform X2 [Lingula anatina]|nr:gamma-aminobutyric acid type B receptor subunit 1 isoform X2 [Lingula anatina]|eukprot:XP_013399006.1 gamma-aminobutyric acid type B receptor subunit 1 isoform X2 [Lingula anatina]
MTPKTDPPVMLLLHHGSVTETDVIGEITGKLKMIQVATGSSSFTLSQRLVFPYLYRTIGSLLDVITIEVDFVKRFGWTRVALLAEDKGSYKEMSKEVETLLRQSGIEIITSIFYRVEQLGQVMEKLKELDARVILHHASGQGSPLCHVFCQAYKYGLFGKKYVWLTLMQNVKDYRNLASSMHQKGKLSCNAEQVVQAAEGQFIIFRADAKHASEVGYEPKRPFTVKDPAEILREMKEQAWYNDDTRRILYQLNYDAIWAAALALNKSLPRLPPRIITNFKYTDLGTVTDALVPEMNRTNFFGASGPVSFSPHGSRMSWLSMEQIRNGTATLFGIYDQKSRNMTLSEKISLLWYIHGGVIPQSGYRTVRTLLVVADELKIAFTVLAVISIVITVVFLLVTIVKWKTQLIQNSWPLMNSVIALGCIFLAVNVILQGSATQLSSTSHIPCNAFVWLFVTGFTLSFGTMLLKMWGVYRLFRYQQDWGLQVELRMLSGVAVLLVIDILMLIIWQLTDPLVVKDRLLPESRDGAKMVRYQTLYRQCHSGSAMGWAIAFIVYKGLLLLVSVCLVWPTWVMSMKRDAGDSSQVGLAMVIIALATVVGVPVGVLVQEEPNVNFGVIAGFTLFAIIATVLLLLIPKLIALKRGEMEPSLWSPLRPYIEELFDDVGDKKPSRAIENGDANTSDNNQGDGSAAQI